MILRCDCYFIYSTAVIPEPYSYIGQQESVLFTVTYFLFIVLLEHDTVFLFRGKLLLLEKNRIDGNRLAEAAAVFPDGRYR